MEKYMRNLFVTLTLLLLVALLPAQDMNPYMNLNHSSICNDGNLRVRWNDLTSNMLGTQCLYSTGAAWQQAFTEPFGDEQMQALVPYTFGQSLRYRLRTELSFEGEQMVFMHTPYLSADTFPPQYANMGLIGTDATGDSMTVYDTKLDFTDSWFAATNNKFYSALANVAGSFPTFNSLTSYNLYATTIANPETAVDTLAYAMVYTFNIAGIISPGLYKISMGEAGVPSFSRIGDIQSQVVSGKLYMACNISDLVNDPDFGAWPNMSNAIMAASISMGISVDFGSLEPEFGLGDYSTMCALLCEDHHYQVNQNTLPVISNFEIEPGEVTGVRFDYTDADADFPLIVEYEIPGVATVPLLPTAYDYTQSVTYSATIPNGTDPATLRVSDNGLDFVEYHYNWVANPEDPLPVATLACRMPNPLRQGLAPFELAFTGLTRAPLQVSVFNVRGQNLGNIFEGYSSQDWLDLAWDGKVAGTRLPSGMYILQINQNDRKESRKFTISD